MKNGKSLKTEYQQREIKRRKKDMNMYQRTLWFKECKLFHLEDSRNSSLWTQEILFHLQNLRSFHLKILKMPVKNITELPITVVMYWHPIGDHPAQGSNS